MSETNAIGFFGVAVALLLGIASLWVAAYQAKLSRRAIESSSRKSIGDRLSQINALALSSPGAIDAFRRLTEPYDLTPNSYFSDARAHLMDLLLSLFQEAFYSLRNGRPIEREQWEAWRQTMNRVFALPWPKGHWQQVSHEYPDDFGACIHEIVEQVPMSADVRPKTGAESKGVSIATDEGLSVGAREVRRQSKSALSDQLGRVLGEHAGHGSIVWTVFGIFWGANAILLVALFQGKELPSPIPGAIISAFGLTMSLASWLLQIRAWHIMAEYQMLVRRVEFALGIKDEYAIAPHLSPNDWIPRARHVILFVSGALPLAWLALFAFFAVQLLR